MLWKSCLDTRYRGELLSLQAAMKNFYEQSSVYYDDIDYTSATWQDTTQMEIMDIIKSACRHKDIVELGCGKANILKSGVVEQSRYTGLEFSSNVIKINRERYPEARFFCIAEASTFPLETASYDYVFSHYVLEHCVFPNLFLNECVRVLRPGGVLSILCPNFLGAGRMSSQRVGFSPGTGREKLRHGKYWDAMVTGLDTRIRIPLHAYRLRRAARKRPRFFVNLAPTCFTDEFSPDVDAVYLTFADEIRSYVAHAIDWDLLGDTLTTYSATHSHIYLKGRKKLADE